jgi:hypothetical protein
MWSEEEKTFSQYWDVQERIGELRDGIERVIASLNEDRSDPEQALHAIGLAIRGIDAFYPTETPPGLPVTGGP